MLYKQNCFNIYVQKPFKINCIKYVSSKLVLKDELEIFLGAAMLQHLNIVKRNVELWLSMTLLYLMHQVLSITPK